MFSSKTTVRRISITGRNISISNGKIIVDGKEIDTGDDKNIVLEVTGDVGKIEADICAQITVTGNAGAITTSQGDIKVQGDVDGSLQTSQGDIEVGGSVNGNATTSMGDIDIRGALGGNARTNMGDIKHRQ